MFPFIQSRTASSSHATTTTDAAKLQALRISVTKCRFIENTSFLDGAYVFDRRMPKDLLSNGLPECNTQRPQIGSVASIQNFGELKMPERSSGSTRNANRGGRRVRLTL